MSCKEQSTSYQKIKPNIRSTLLSQQSHITSRSEFAFGTHTHLTHTTKCNLKYWQMWSRLQYYYIFYLEANNYYCVISDECSKPLALYDSWSLRRIHKKGQWHLHRNGSFHKLPTSSSSSIRRIISSLSSPTCDTWRLARSCSGRSGGRGGGTPSLEESRLRANDGSFYLKH